MELVRIGGTKSKKSAEEWAKATGVAKHITIKKVGSGWQLFADSYQVYELAISSIK